MLQTIITFEVIACDKNKQLTVAFFFFQNLNEYVEALITLKQKIINTE